MEFVRLQEESVEACTGDLLIVESELDKYYLLFGENDESRIENDNGKFEYSLTNLENGEVFYHELEDEEEIRIGTTISRFGEVIEIIDNDRLRIVIK